MVDEISYTSNENNFLEVIHRELSGFSKRRNFRNLLVFPPFSPRYRFLTHKTVENFTNLSSISVGKDIKRRTVVFFKKISRKHVELMTSEKVSVKEPSGDCIDHVGLVKGRGRGRGRARRRCEGSEDIANEYCKGLRRPPQQFYQPGAFSRLTNNKENRKADCGLETPCESNNKINIEQCCEINENELRTSKERERKSNNDNCIEKKDHNKISQEITTSMKNTDGQDVTLQGCCISTRDHDAYSSPKNKNCVEGTSNSILKDDNFKSSVHDHDTNVMKSKNDPESVCGDRNISGTKVKIKSSKDKLDVVSVDNKSAVPGINTEVKIKDISMEESSIFDEVTTNDPQENTDKTTDHAISDPTLEDTTLIHNNNGFQDNLSSVQESDICGKVEFSTMVEKHAEIQCDLSSLSNVDANIGSINNCTVTESLDTKKDIDIPSPITDEQKTKNDLTPQEMTELIVRDDGGDHSDSTPNLIPEKANNNAETVSDGNIPCEVTQCDEADLGNIAPNENCKQKSKRQTKKEAKAKKKSEKLKKKTKASKEKVAVVKVVETSVKDKRKAEVEESGNTMELENKEHKEQVAVEVVESSVKDNSKVDVGKSGNTMELENNEEELDWEANWNDDGECLTKQDLLILDEVVDIDDVTVENPKYDYLKFTPKHTILDPGVYDHVVELYDFSPELKTPDLIHAFSNFKTQGFDIQWVDDTHALAVFSNHKMAETVIKQCSSPLIKMRSLYDGTHESKLKAKRNIDFLKPYKDRPKTSKLVANRLVAGALGVKSKMSKEERELERKKIKEEREKKLNTERQKKDLWESDELGVNK